MYDLITILGPTACGKTTLAAHLADRLGGEIISADSRQIYRGMDIGTGKDLGDYIIGTRAIPYYLIDIAPAGYRYNLFEYQRDFLAAYNDIKGRGVVPILCGGTGLYIESVLRGYQMMPVPENPELRERLSHYTLEELTQMLMQYKTLHNTTDVDTPKRAIRALEIQMYYREHGIDERSFPSLRSLTIGVGVDREVRRNRITQRLHQRLQEGMIEEVRTLLQSVSPEDLMYYGLEYKFLTQYCIGQLSYDEMVQGLEIAIHQFAKRQMTWFRGMERRGLPICWIDGTADMEDKLNKIITLWQQK